MRVAVIGGGAAGFFAAIATKVQYPDVQVDLYEKTSQVLSKVKVSGGGRCNVTHACFEIGEMVRNYPRGSRVLKKAFHQFFTTHTIEWFEQKGVPLKTEEDGRMFPVSNRSQSIIDALLTEVNRLGVAINTRTPIDKITKTGDRFELYTQGNRIFADRVVYAIGGVRKVEALQPLSEFNLKIVPPVPSLFTFNIPAKKLNSLMGLSVPHTMVRIPGIKLQSEGPLLITHWGISGPAVLKLSAFGARTLAERNYQHDVMVNWTGMNNEDEIRQHLTVWIAQHSNAGLYSNVPFSIPKRLWKYLLDKLELSEDIIWGAVGKKLKNRLINHLMNDTYKVNGKTTFKEEFVTCGGIDLAEIKPQTMECKKIPGLFFCGEVLDIDGITGGFNFQAAWTTGFIAGQSVLKDRNTI